jgi:hypothetical protein
VSRLPILERGAVPIGSMGIYTNIEGILMVNVTIYSIHGSYGVRGKERPAAVSFFGKRLDLWWIRHDTMISLFFAGALFP